MSLTEEELNQKLAEAVKTYYQHSEGKVECKNTYKIQRASVCLFAASLGYAYDLFSEADGGSFYNAVGKELSHMETVSFAKMQEFHNQYFMDNTCWHGAEKELPKMAEKLDIPLEWLQNAIEAKLVKRTFFQVSKDKRLKVQKHLVKFA